MSKRAQSGKKRPRKTLSRTKATTEERGETAMNVPNAQPGAVNKLPELQGKAAQGMALVPMEHIRWNLRELEQLTQAYTHAHMRHYNALVAVKQYSPLSDEYGWRQSVLVEATTELLNVAKRLQQCCEKTR